MGGVEYRAKPRPPKHPHFAPLRKLEVSVRDTSLADRGQDVPVALSTHITNALDHAMSYADSIDKARKDAKGMTHDQVRVVILPIVSRKHGVPLVDGKGKAQGTKVFDSSHTKYEAAKKAGLI